MYTPLAHRSAPRGQVVHEDSSCVSAPAHFDTKHFVNAFSLACDLDLLLTCCKCGDCSHQEHNQLRIHLLI